MMKLLFRIHLQLREPCSSTPLLLPRSQQQQEQSGSQDNSPAACHPDALGSCLLQQLNFMVKGGASAQSSSSINRIRATRKLHRIINLMGARVPSHTSSGLVARTWMENPHLLKLSWSLIIKALAAAVALVSLVGFVCGINQIFAQGIDKVNKPYLPIASGELSLGSAWLLVMGIVATGLSIAAALKSVPLAGFLAFEYLMAYIYSAPPFRTKISTIGAILTIAWMGGGCGFTMALYSAARATLGLPFQLSMPVAFLTIFSTLFCLAKGFMKDKPDYEGDKKYNVPTLPTIIGLRRTAYLGFGIMTYGSVISAAPYMPQAFKPRVMIPAHILPALSLVYQAWMLENANYRKEEAHSFYVFMWNLLQAEYLILPFI